MTEPLVTAYAQTSQRLTGRLSHVFREVGRVVFPVFVVGSDDADASRPTFIYNADAFGALGERASAVLEASTRDVQAVVTPTFIGGGTQLAAFVLVATPSMPDLAPTPFIPAQWMPSAFGTPSALLRTGRQTIVNGGFAPRVNLGESIGPVLVRAGSQLCVLHEASGVGANFEARFAWREL